MIKKNGDWTGKLIEKLIEGKKKKLKLNEISNQHNEELIFEVLLECEGEIKKSF